MKLTASKNGWQPRKKAKKEHSTEPRFCQEIILLCQQSKDIVSGLSSTGIEFWSYLLLIFVPVFVLVQQILQFLTLYFFLLIRQLKKMEEEGKDSLIWLLRIVCEIQHSSFKTNTVRFRLTPYPLPPTQTQHICIIQHGHSPGICKRIDTFPHTWNNNKPLALFEVTLFLWTWCCVHRVCRETKVTRKGLYSTCMYPTFLYQRMTEVTKYWFSPHTCEVLLLLVRKLSKPDASLSRFLPSSSLLLPSSVDNTSSEASTLQHRWRHDTRSKGWTSWKRTDSQTDKYM